MKRRLAAVMSIVLAGAAAHATPALANAHGPGAGSYSSNTLGATYTFASDDFSQHVDLFLSDSLTTSQPLGGPPTSTHKMQVFFSAGANGQEDSGCFLLDGSDFVISPDLSSASLHKTVTADSPACDFPPTLADPEVTLDVTWTGIGPANTGHTTEQSGCQGFQIETVTSGTNNRATAAATISPLFSDAMTATRAVVYSGDFTNHVQGTSPPLCAAGGAPGPGLGPRGPGKYVHTGSGVGQQLANADSGDNLDLFAGTTTDASNPQTGPSTNTTLTSVSITLLPSFQSACFLVDSSAIRVATNLSGAALHATVTDSTPTCDSTPATLPLPITIDATFTGIGPVGTTRNNSWRSCGSFRSEDSTSLTNNNSSAVATLSGAINESFVSTQSANESSGSIGSQSLTTHIGGVISPDCLF